MVTDATGPTSALAHTISNSNPGHAARQRTREHANTKDANQNHQCDTHTESSHVAICARQALLRRRPSSREEEEEDCIEGRGLGAPT
eukprot:4033221-Prymnesium_polylepis.1